jgi:hypothetical protein
MMATGEELFKIECWVSGDIKSGSAEEIEVRRLAARLLRAGDFAVRQALAIIVDPDHQDGNAYGTQMVFKRRRGNRSNCVDDRNVAAVIWHEHQAGRGRKAYQAAVAQLGVSLRTAKAAYKKWKPIFEKDGTRLKALTRITKK